MGRFALITFQKYGELESWRLHGVTSKQQLSCVLSLWCYFYCTSYHIIHFVHTLLSSYTTSNIHMHNTPFTLNTYHPTASSQQRRLPHFALHPSRQASHPHIPISLPLLTFLTTTTSFILAFFLLTRNSFTALQISTQKALKYFVDPLIGTIPTVATSLS